MSLPTTRKSSHNLRDEDDGEYSNEAEGVSRTKVKSKAKPINPTEVCTICQVVVNTVDL